MLLQIDGSRHDWLEGRGPYLTLVGAIDDATGTVPAPLFRQEDAQGYMLMLREVIKGRAAHWPCTATGTASSSAPPQSPRPSPSSSGAGVTHTVRQGA